MKLPTRLLFLLLLFLAAPALAAAPIDAHAAPPATVGASIEDESELDTSTAAMATTAELEAFTLVLTDDDDAPVPEACWTDCGCGNLGATCRVAAGVNGTCQPCVRAGQWCANCLASKKCGCATSDEVPIID